MHAHMRVLLVSTLVAGGLSSAAHAATVEVDKLVGKQAAASFTGTARIKCANKTFGTLSAFGFLSGSETITKTTGTPKTVDNGVFIEISYTNSCTGASLSFADGSVPNGFTPPDARLNSAGLDGTTTVQDVASGNTATVSLDVVFEGVGPITAEKSNTKTKTVDGPHGPVTITITRDAAGSRAADASGTITVAGVALTSTFTSVSLSDHANQTITITKN
jgi:hypothetical protein